MKKFLLVLSSFSIIFCATAQNSTQCLTCKQGMHDGLFNKAVSNTSLTSKVANLPRTSNGNSTFGQSYVVQNLCGFNYVTGSVNTQTRASWQPGTGFPTTVPIAGLPAGFVVQSAFVYYGCSYTEVTPPATTVTITNPSLVSNTIASVMIGQGGDVCWGAKGTCGYRCDVTAAISGNGNYKIDLNGFLNAAYEVDGVTLIITYVDPAALYSGSISIWDGNIIGIGTQVNYTGTGFTSCTASSAGSAFGLFGDIQNNVNGGINKDDFNGSSATFTNDFWNTNVIPTSVAACQTSCVFNSYVGNSSDCVLWTAAGLYWQYNTCTACNAMTVTDVAVNPSCGNNNGSITINVVGGTAPYTYTWTPNVSTTSTATGLSAGSYQIQIKDAACNIQTINVILTSVSLNVVVTQTNILCAGQANGTVHFSVSGGTKPYTYNWNPNVSTDSDAINLSAGSYTVSISDLVGCTYHDTITITSPPVLTAPVVVTNVTCNGGSDGKVVATAGGGVPAYTYSWTNGSTTDSAVNLSAGTYTLTLTDNNGCTFTVPATITQPNAMTVVVSGPQTICAGTSGVLTATVNGGTAPYTYKWSDGNTTKTDTVIPAFTQTYSVNITDANGCKTSSQFTVILGPPLSVVTKGPNSVCSGSGVTICATAIGGTGGNTYVWQPGNLTGACINVFPTSSTTYTVTATDNCGTTATAIKLISVNPLPSINFSADVYQGCAPLCIQFRNKTTLAGGGGILSYVWTFGNGDSSHSQNPVFCYPSSGNYSVGLTVTSDSGCSATLTKLSIINVYNHPNASFSLSPQPATIISPTIQFTDQSSSQYGLSYWWWTFGDGSGDATINLQNPSHTYGDTGSYCARMIVMDVHGCTDTATNCLIIDPVFNLYIPDAFSPNGDGKNEVFQPVGQYIKTFEMYIFDRWGMQLFHTTDINNGWTGKVKGGSLISQEDTYVYKIYVIDSKNKSHSYVGNVTLLK